MVVVSKIVKDNWRAVLIYSLVALLILWPLLGPGYILTLDMVFTPKLAMPETVTSSFLLHAGLHFLNMIIASDILEKMMLFVILLLSGLGMHRLIRSLQRRDAAIRATEWGAYASGLLYMINPFTYSRFMAGQYSVLLGYACLPFFVIAILRFLKKPSLKSSLVLSMWTVGISIVSIHTLGLAFVVAVVALVQTVWHNRTNIAQLKQLATYGVIAGMTFLVVSSYWLVPFIQGKGVTAASIDTFRTSDQSAFATVGDGVASKLVHVARLQGFWAESRDQYSLPQDKLGVWWGLVVILVWAVIIVGAIATWRQKRKTAILFTTCMVIASLLSVGVGMTWLAGHVPFFAGYREPQKFVALVALSYAVFVGFAIPRLLRAIHTKIGRIGVGVILTLMLIGFTPVMFRGFDGQLIPRQYPADWYTINKQLNDDTGRYQVLSLPWHLYMHYEFAGRIIANPGNSFFDRPLLISDDPELGDVSPAVADTQKQLLTTRILPQASHSSTLGKLLVPLHVKYVLLFKDSDYAAYGYLDHQTDLKLVTESATLKLYRNTAFKENSR